MESVPPPSPDTRRWSARGSGDLRADRRFLYAQEALRAGDAEAAADLARQTLDLAPEWPPAWMLLGEAEAALGRREAAHAAFGEARRRDAEDRLGAGLRLAAMGEAPSPAAMSAAYVTALFDDYAPRFETHLTQALGYRAPQEIAARLAALAAGRPAPAFARVVDLGCGTGLMAAALSGLAGAIAGCDLSPAMVEVARRTGLYDRLAVADAVAFLSGEPDASVDLVTAADVLVYLGDLAPLLAQASRVLAPDGLFAATIQTGPEDGFRLGEDLRFHHAPAAVAALAAAQGLPLVVVEAVAVRLDRGQPVPSALLVGRRQGR